MSASTFHVERTPTYDPTLQPALSPLEQHGYDCTPFPTTVPKELVHRASDAEVFLTGWQRHDDTHFTVTAQWPGNHGFYSQVAGDHHDPLICVETIRQLGILLGHAEFGLPLGHQYLLWDLGITIHQPEHLKVQLAPASLDIDVTFTEVIRRAGKLSKIGYEAVIRRDGHIVATGRVSSTCTSPAVYSRLRPPHTLQADHRPLPLTAPVAPQSVGRLSPTDVVLSPVSEPNCWQARVDIHHASLFDHPVDHIPGMLLLEAARQASAATLGRSSFLPLSIVGDFKRFAELDMPCIIEAHRVYDDAPGAPDTVRVTGRQEGDLIFTAVVTAASYTS